MKTKGTFGASLGRNFDLSVVGKRHISIESQRNFPMRLSSNDGSVVLKSTNHSGLLVALIPITRFYWMAIISHNDFSSIPVLSYRIGDPKMLISELNEVSSWSVVAGNHIADNFGFTELLRVEKKPVEKAGKV